MAKTPIGVPTEFRGGKNGKSTKCLCRKRIKPGAECVYLPGSNMSVIAVCVPCAKLFKLAFVRPALESVRAEAETMLDTDLEAAAALVLKKLPTTDVGSVWQPDVEEAGPVVEEIPLADLKTKMGEHLPDDVLARRRDRATW